ncbi:MAG TPA: amino acid permease, partial [Parvularculaceae bacterium]|nr:amino acid permease [Parvularculaceae bacterium]
MKDLFRRKSIDELVDHRSANRLRPSLSAWHLVLLGVGAIVGTGIYTLVGVGADRAGPAVILSFAIAGAVGAFAALAYAE